MNYINQLNDYPEKHLSLDDLLPHPYDLFAKWYEEVESSMTEVLFEANAMTLATVSATGIPHARIVLLKSYSRDGFVFFSNYSSAKGCDLAFNSNASLLFWWPSFFRQIRIEGVVEKLSADESDMYFNQRPLSSRVSACISDQSKPLHSKQELLDSYRKCMQQYQKDGDIKRPEDWGGYIVTPNLFEFWQAAPNRLHDRFRYTRDDHDWGIVRLAP